MHLLLSPCTCARACMWLFVCVHVCVAVRICCAKLCVYHSKEKASVHLVHRAGESGASGSQVQIRVPAWQVPCNRGLPNSSNVPLPLQARLSSLPGPSLHSPPPSSTEPCSTHKCPRPQALAPLASRRCGGPVCTQPHLQVFSIQHKPSGAQQTAFGVHSTHPVEHSMHPSVHPKAC